MEDCEEGLRKECPSCRANGPAARAMGMARCLPAELHRESEGTGPGLRGGSQLPGELGQEEQGEGSKAEPWLSLF